MEPMIKKDIYKKLNNYQICSETPPPKTRTIQELWRVPALHEASLKDISEQASVKFKMK